MIMLSKLRHFDVVDNHGGRARLIDLSIDVLESDYPPIRQLVCRLSNRQELMLPWSAVTDIDWRRSRITVRSITGTSSTAEEALGDQVFLRRDVLDALVLDLHNRRATRANDLWLAEENGHLFLKAADTSARAIFRRLSGGRFGQKPSRAPYDWKYIEFLRGDPRAVRMNAGYRMRIKHLPPGEIAGLSCAIPYLHAAELLTLLPDRVAADTLEAMGLERQVQVFGELEEEQGLRLLILMASDDATDLLGRLPPAITKGYLERLPKHRSEQLVDLLRYPENTAGGIMTNDIVTFPGNLTVLQARSELRQRLSDPDFAHFIYIVDGKEKRSLQGTISMRDFVVAADDQRLHKIMNPYVSALQPLEPATAAAYRVINSNMAALPVIGRDLQLLGIVTVDAAVVQVASSSWKALAPKIFS